ncbi:MAG: hypothetical protein WDN72_02835 [Alphaproteobacteria bacterium]
MADDIFSEPASDAQLRESDALDTAIAQARAELGAMMQAASAADMQGAQLGDYTLHEVMGVGRYAVPRRHGWLPLIEIIRNPGANIDFSLRDYPVFDSILSQHFDALQLSDPINDDYESWLPLRDNIAAVRNFLMQTYYTNTPPGMTPGKARESLAQIAAFVGDGLHNNRLLLGLVPNHDPRKPFISISEASRTGGRGAQYLYEKILEMQRQSNWMRPFAPIVAMFGGKPTHDWMLPGPYATPFNALYYRDELNAAASPQAQMQAALQRLDQLQARRAQLRQSAALTMQAVDLDAIGNHLLFTADHLSGIASMAEPTRREAVDIAKDILRKLKISIGNLNILEGLRLKPSDDLAALGAIKGVVLVYERLLAWGRGIDPSIMQHPSIMAATQAIGQLGYLAKARGDARGAGRRQFGSGRQDRGAAQAQSRSISRVASEPQFGGLLDRVERGIDTVLNRIQEINGPGAMVGHLPSKDLGSYMSGAPIAGQAMTLSADGARDARRPQRRDPRDAGPRQSARRRSASRRRAPRAPSSRATRHARHRARRPGGRRLQQARATQQRSTSAAATSNPALNQPGMLTAAQRSALAQRAAMQHVHEEEEEQQHLDRSLMMQFRKAMSLNTATGQLVQTGRGTIDAMARANAQPKIAAAAQNANNQQFVQKEAAIHTGELRRKMPSASRARPRLRRQNKGSRGIF